MNREALAWAAGFFDGEGSTIPHWRRRSIAITIGQKEREPLDRFREAVGGLGHVDGPHSYSGQATMYRFRTDRGEHVQAIVAMLWPWLGSVKRAQARTVLESWTAPIRHYAEAM